MPCKKIAAKSYCKYSYPKSLDNDAKMFGQTVS